MRRMNRRTFIATTAAATLAPAARSAWTTESAHKIGRIGLQLYTVREAMKTDVAGTIAKVASTGYQEVEFAGYFDHSAKDIRALLDKNGLASPSCHVGYDLVEKRWPETLDAAKIVGHRYIICPWIDEKQRVEPFRTIFCSRPWTPNSSRWSWTSAGSALLEKIPSPTSKNIPAASRSCMSRTG